MRLTINLEDDLYAMARAHSVVEGISISRAVNNLLRGRMQQERSSSQGRGSLENGAHPLSGFPVSRGGDALIPPDAVRRMEEEEDERDFGGRKLPSATAKA